MKKYLKQERFRQNCESFLVRKNNLRKVNITYDSITVIMSLFRDRYDGKNKALGFDFVAEYIVKATNKKELK
jgi:hypothetical protein